MTATKKTTNNENPEETEKKKTVKKAAPKKTTAKKAAGEKKPAAKKTTAKKPAAKKTAAKKPAAKKTAKKAEEAKEILDTVQHGAEQNAAAEQTKPAEVINAPEKAPAPVHKEEPAPVKEEPKAAVQPEAKPQPAPAVKAEAKPEHKQEFKPSEPKAEVKREFKPQPKPAQPQQQNRHEHKREEQKPTAPAQSNEKVIKILGQPTIKELAEKMDIKINDFIKKLMGMGIFATINQRLEQDMIELVVAECGFKAEITHEFAEDKIAAEDHEQEDPAHLKPRAPVVTIMGHVDHGKTSLLDAIRHSNVVAGEFGAITQHIGAYRVKTPKGYISFLDTPGHEAFTAMRARGAQATDIVVLVVSATDGIMPQTIEAINHAQSAGAPIIVAVNKIDLPGANPDKVKQELANRGLIPEEWQGNTIYVEISAKKRINIDKLLEMISLQAEMMELKANPDRRGVGVILESKRDNKRGVVATVLVQKGTMRVGDPFIVGTNYGKIRALIDEHGKRLPSAGPAVPAEVLGINGEPPAVGDTLFVTESEKEAKHIAEKRKLAHKEEKLAHQKHVSLSSLKSDIEGKNVKELAIILKADVHGSIEAIKDAILRTPTEEVQVKIIHSGAGNVNESDILLAKASNAVVIAFNVDSDSKAAEEAEKEGIEIRKYNIIFELLEDLRAAMEGLLEPEIVEERVGLATVRQTFDLSSGFVAGSYIEEGKVVRGYEVRVLRGGEQIYKGKISGLKRFKDDVKEVEKGYECGISIDGFRQTKPGDTIECIQKKTITRRISKI
ncbi:translation initiation factor IF-2 [Candidatus Proelusimicrobium excrementi]|uniref:translation initiation factor IF-2 n=1 Tax=Candidatus Proelusimicrobium excrementi TaxID=3416222 RepID=UPI003C88DF01|nr:translation initiation factor IF-2 [Elusimicrobiaceae bacterium]